MSKAEEIVEYYNVLLPELWFEQINKKLRKKVKKRLKTNLPFLSKIICDDSNNPPSIIDNNHLMVRVFWKENMIEKYMDLTF